METAALFIEKVDDILPGTISHVSMSETEMLHGRVEDINTVSAAYLDHFAPNKK